MSSPCGIVLAAGEGRRMGGPKALLELDGVTLVEQHVARLVSAGCDPVIVIVRPAQAEAVRLLLEPYPAVRVEGAPTASQADSLAVALHLSKTPNPSDVLIITPVDLLPAELHTHRALLAALTGDALAVTPTHGGRGGHPVIARRALFHHVGAPLRDLLHELGAARRRVEVPDSRVLGDFDVPSDLHGLPSSRQ